MMRLVVKERRTGRRELENTSFQRKQDAVAVVRAVQSPFLALNEGREGDVPNYVNEKTSMADLPSDYREVDGDGRGQ